MNNDLMAFRIAIWCLWIACKWVLHIFETNYDGNDDEEEEDGEKKYFDQQKNDNKKELHKVHII